MDINKINGNEIIEFLNSLDMDSDKLFDISTSKPFVFKSQEINGDTYELNFAAHFNNWGTFQEISDNILIITSDGNLSLHLNEPFEGDGSADILEDFLTEWIKTHTFDTDYVNHFNSLVLSTNQILSNCEYGDFKTIDVAIKNLTKAKTLIK
jgi:hypothetical protein